MSMNTASVLWVWIPPLYYECEYRLWAMSVNTASVLWVWIPPLCHECEYRLCIMSVNTASVLWVWIPPLCHEYEYRLCIMSVNTASVAPRRAFIYPVLPALYRAYTVCIYSWKQSWDSSGDSVSRFFHPRDQDWLLASLLSINISVYQYSTLDTKEDKNKNYIITESLNCKLLHTECSGFWLWGQNSRKISLLVIFLFQSFFRILADIWL